MYEINVTDTFIVLRVKQKVMRVILYQCDFDSKKGFRNKKQLGRQIQE